MDFPNIRIAPLPIITPWSLESLGFPLSGRGLTLTGSLSTTWPTASSAFFYPFRLFEPATVYQLGWYVGAAASGSLDIGIYDAQYNLVVSSGGTSMSGTNAIQLLNIADTVLPPGEYYLAGSNSNTTGTCFAASSNDEFTLPAVAVLEMASANPLPSVATPVLSTQASPPIFVLAAILRSTF